MRQQFGRRLVHSSSVMTADSSSMVQQLQPQSTFDQNQSFEDEWSMVNFANAGGLVVTTSSSTGLEGGGGSPQPESLTGVSFACAILEKAILDEAAGAGQGNCKEVGTFQTGLFLTCTSCHLLRVLG